jgi:hypothetical protein
LVEAIAVSSFNCGQWRSASRPSPLLHAAIVTVYIVLAGHVVVQFRPSVPAGCAPRLRSRRRANVALRKLGSNLLKGQSLGLQSTGNRTNRCRERIGLLLTGFHSNGGRDFRAASPATKLDTTNPCSSQGGLGALRYKASLQCRHGCHLVQHERANRTDRQRRQLAEHHAALAAAFDHGQQEADVPGEPIDLGDQTRARGAMRRKPIQLPPICAKRARNSSIGGGGVTGCWKQRAVPTIDGLSRVVFDEVLQTMAGV